MKNLSNNDFYTVSAIALNNMGVSLVERCCFQEASEIFHDSLQVFLSNQPAGLGQRDPFMGHIEKTPLSPAQVEYRLYRASLHLSSKSEQLPSLVALQDDESTSSSSSLPDDVLTTEYEQEEPSFDIYNQYGEDMSLNKSSSLFGGFLGDSQEYFVYFQQPLNGQGLKNTASHLEAAILHNKGQTFRYLAQTMSGLSTPQKSEQLLDKADTLIFLSQQVAAHGQNISE
jgi:hypothetical protein